MKEHGIVIGDPEGMLDSLIEKKKEHVISLFEREKIEIDSSSIRKRRHTLNIKI